MNFKRKLAVLKFTMLRGYNWCQMPTLAIIAATMLKPYFPSLNIYVLSLITFGTFMIVGILDKKLGILYEENSYATETNPTLMQGLFKGKANLYNQKEVKKTNV
jgi:hypothetical protein